MQAMSTDLKREAGNTENSLCNRIQLRDVNILLILCECGTTDLCEDSAIFKRLVHGLLNRYTHHWRVFL